MPDLDRASGPELAPPMLATSPLRATPLAVGGLAAVAAGAAMIWLVGASEHATKAIPASPADLGESVVTEVDASDRGAVAAAVSMLRLPDAQRQEIAQEVARRERRIGWIVLTDSMDPDGDTVSVEAAGLIQQVLLSKAWMPVAIPMNGGPIHITAVRDGGGGGITVALATRRGSLALRALLPGERIEVMP
ncbi:MAG: hypothetical protein K2Z80_07885 [Xanthobacteraceae bacterium]|nr:hypothetical protein [Xanthobacteraceae bacterium]